MADIQMLASWRLVVNGSEFRLISKALRGAPMTEEEKREAAELQKKFMQDRHKHLKLMVQESQKAVDNIALSEQQDLKSSDDASAREVPAEKSSPVKVVEG